MQKGTGKIKVALMFGGKSVEHEISLMSSKNIAEAMDKNKYEIIFVEIDKKGNFDLDLLKKADVVFPILHGPFGEDGTIQGFLKILNLPFVGPSVLGSSVGFDKDVTKRLLNEARIPNTKFMTFRKGEKISFPVVKKFLGMPSMIKPANSGSSVGISKASDEKEFIKAVKEGFKFDNKIIIEKFLKDRREIECAVLGNDNPKASICGEVITSKNHTFYTYEAKYFDPNGAVLEIPAKISKTLQKKIQDLAIKTYKTLELEGMTRVDFFMNKKGDLFVNEVNTIPGFTNISMYPTLWKNSGISYTKLIDRLFELAFERFYKEQKLQTSVK
jgi:D-alanine-D-alanine ligase